MKAFNRENFRAFMATESVTDEDSTLISSHGMAEQVLERFDAWLAEPETVESLVKLPVYAKGVNVVDADGAFVCKCHAIDVAQAVANKMNQDYLPEDEGDVEPSVDDEDEEEE